MQQTDPVLIGILYCPFILRLGIIAFRMVVVLIFFFLIDVSKMWKLDMLTNQCRSKMYVRPVAQFSIRNMSAEYLSIVDVGIN